MTAVLLVSSLLSFNQVAQHRSKDPTWTFELRLAPYNPQISENPNNKRMFNSMFRKARKGAIFDDHPIMWALELDHYFSTRMGQLGLGGRVGYWKVSGRTRICGDPSAPRACNETEATTGSRGNSEQSLTIVPLSVSAVWRLDQGFEELGIPIVPYVKAGLDWHLWRVRVNGEITKTRNGDEAHAAEGGVLGWHAAGGVALNIDWLDPGAKGASGLQRSYLFVEAMHIQGDHFGLKPGMRTSDFVILGGLSLDFD